MSSARNRTLQRLSYIWLAQNVVLAISVCVRNYWYIHYYALAYKRIGVGFFLLATCVGLVLVMLKVSDRGSSHFLLRWNMFSVLCIGLVMALFDWDTIIARYNMAQRGKAFVELDYLTTMSDRTLPYLIRSNLQLEDLDTFNEHLLGGVERYSRTLYMDPQAYVACIHVRTERFLNKYPERSWREWKWADAWSYHLLLDAH